jgi:hypothetical protein
MAVAVVEEMAAACYTHPVITFQKPKCRNLKINKHYQ